MTTAENNDPVTTHDRPQSVWLCDMGTSQQVSFTQLPGGFEYFEYVPKPTPEEQAHTQRELFLLRQVYEGARKLLRHNGIDAAAAAQAGREMDAAIELIKELDGGTMDDNIELPQFPMSPHQIYDMDLRIQHEPGTNAALVEVVRKVEEYHKVGLQLADKPSTEYVGNGMFKGEKPSEAALGWALRFHDRGDTEVSNLLRALAAELQLHENDQTYRYVYMLCDAYESGIGHGIQRDGHDNEALNLYGAPYSCNLAYRIGYKQGDKRRAGEERKEKESTPKPFASPWGAWFPVNVMGIPMHEYESGKWESATWPSQEQKLGKR